MICMMKMALAAVLSLFRERARLEAEIVVLRHQLNILRRSAPHRVQLSNFDRVLLVWLYRLCPSILNAICLVRPETIVRWHRQGLRVYWRWRSRRVPGRPKMDKEVRDLIRQISMANPLWGAPRIHGEILKLGIDVAQSTVAKYMARRGRPPGQSWRTFLRNHVDGIAAVDFLVVPTIAFKLLFVFVVLRHRRRELVAFGVTAHPTAEWLARQIAEAFPWETTPEYMLRDRDGSYGAPFRRRVRAMGIRDRPVAPRSPWQNGHVERVIGSIRRECLDHIIVANEAHLRRVVGAYARYYNNTRTHLAIDKDAPFGRAVQMTGQINIVPHLGGLHNSFVRI